MKKLWSSVFAMFVMMLLCVYALPAYCYQAQLNDPNRNMSGYWYTSGNRLYPSFRGECTWYVCGRCGEQGWTPNYLGDAGGWYNNVSNGGSKDLTPTRGSIMCMPGHVAFVVQVINQNSWVVDEYNEYPAYAGQWDEETITRNAGNLTSIHSEIYNHWYTLSGFIHPPSLPDGLYAPSNEGGVFLVSGGVRRAFLSADSFNHWGENWGSIQTVGEDTIYNRTGWQSPIPDLITAPGRGINWIENGTARPISSGDVYNAMGFLWSDYRNVSQAEFDRYPCSIPTLNLNAAEPRLIVTDGPYVNKNAGSQSGGFRIRNLSQSNIPFDVTVRVYRSDGWWQDFPWQKNVTLGQNQEDVWWSNNSLPSGHYTFSVLYSYWANGINMQFNAPVAGVNPYTTQQGMFDLP